MRGMSRALRLAESILLIVIAAGYVAFSEERTILILICIFWLFACIYWIKESFYLLLFMVPLAGWIPKVMGAAKYSLSELLAIVFLSVWLMKSDDSKKSRSLIVNKAERYLAWFLVLTGVSALPLISEFEYYGQSIGIDSHFYTLKVIADTIVWYLLFRYAYHELGQKDFQKMKKVLLGSFFVVCAISIIQHVLDGKRSMIPFSSPNILGSYIILFLAFALIHIDAIDEGRNRWFYRIAGILGIISLYYSGSRGAMLGLLLGLITWQVLLSKRSTNAAKYFVIGIFGILLLSAVLIMQSRDLGTALQDRSLILEDAVTTIINKPFFGVGAGAYVLSGHAQGVLHTHNLYLQILIERGILAFYFFLLFIISLSKSIIRDARIETLGVGLVAVLMHGFFDYPFFEQKIGILFFIIAGYCMRMDEQQRFNREKEKKIIAETLVLIPANNEQGSISTVVKEFKKKFQVVVCDNASTDNTADEAKLAGAYIIKEPNKGKGNAIRKLLEHKAKYYIITDGDGAFYSEDARKFVDMLKKGKADMVIGKRTQRNVHSRNYIWFRSKLLVLLEWLFQKRYGTQVDDFMSGYRVFNHETRKKLKLNAQGFDIDTEITMDVLDAGLKIIEEPVQVRARIEGKQKAGVINVGLPVLKLLLMRK